MRFGRWFIIWREYFHCKDEEWHVVVLAPQTGEAEGPLTSSGNVTHFSRGEEPWAGRADVAQMSLHTHTHPHPPTHRTTHTHTQPNPFAHFLFCLYFLLKYPQKKNQRHSDFGQVSFRFVVPHRRELMWSSACAYADEVEHDKKEGVSGSFRLDLVGFFQNWSQRVRESRQAATGCLSATLLLLCKLDIRRQGDVRSNKASGSVLYWV